MDDPACDPDRLRETLRRFDTVNRLVSGWDTVYRRHLRPLLRSLGMPARVLDLGCGDGALMAALRDEKQVDARGMELDQHGVAECVARGLSVMQGDADSDLADYPDAAFDYAILSQTLQTTHRPDLVLDHLLRIGRKAVMAGAAVLMGWQFTALAVGADGSVGLQVAILYR